MNLKFRLLLGLLICWSCSFAQTLTPKEQAVFDEIAYKRMQEGNYEVILKWVVPIRYRVIGEADDYINKEIDTTFSQLRTLTKLDIKKTNDPDEANFNIYVGVKNLEELPKNLLKYANSVGGGSYRTNKNAEIIKIECLVRPDKYSDKADVRAVLKKNITKYMGFFKTTSQAPSSLFYNANNGKLKIDDFDSHLLLKLYDPTIKPGMDKDQVDTLNKR